MQMHAARIHTATNQHTGRGRDVDPSDSSPQCGRELVDPLVNTSPSERFFKAARCHADNLCIVGLLWQAVLTFIS